MAEGHLGIAEGRAAYGSTGTGSIDINDPNSTC